MEVVGENADRVDDMTAISCLCLLQVLTDELEEINSLLCAPCGCDLCCTGPTSSMEQEFFEIPITDSEVELFTVERHESKDSKRRTSQEDPALAVG